MAQSPQLYDPALVYVTPVSRAWASTGNTDVVTDLNVLSASQIIIMNTSAYAGRWYISNVTPTTTSVVNGQNVITAGSFTVTSSSSETQTTTLYEYTII